MEQSNGNITFSKIIEKIQLIIGILTLMFFGLGLIIFMTDGVYDPFENYIIIFVFIVLGVILIKSSRKRHRLIKNFREYASRLSVDQTGSIEELASSLGTSQEIVKYNLKKMIDKKFLINAYIDEEENRIIFSQTNIVSTPVNIHSSIKQNNNQIEFDTVTCKSCGGVNKIQKGKVHECEFCGSHIN